MACAEKSNEITAIPEILRLVDIDEQLEGALANAREHVATEKGHGCEETRTYLQLPAAKSLKGFTRWKVVKIPDIHLSQPDLHDHRASDEQEYQVGPARQDPSRTGCER